MMAKTEPVQHPVRQVNQPTLVMIRELHSHWDGKRRQVPINNVPPERRTGTLEVVLCLEGLALRGSETENVYPNGVGFTYTRGCEVYLEVFPRGRTQKDYEGWQRNLVHSTVLLQGVRTPLAVSPTAMKHPSGVHRPGASGLEHMTLLAPGKIVHYLTGVLPLLGVDPADMETTVQHITNLLRVGVQELSEMPRR